MQTVTGPDRTRNGASRAALGTNREAALPERAAELIRAVGRLPGELLAAEMAVGGRVLVDRASKIHVPDDRGRPEVERVPDDVHEAAGVDLLRPERVTPPRARGGRPQCPS